MKVFWSRCGHGYGNFGDKLTPLFLDLLKIRYEWAPPESADLIGIGSLLEKIPDDYKGVIWSTGSMYPMPKNLPEATILALRGKSTLENLHAKPNHVALGDGGLLCNLLAEPCPKEFKLGLIPHFVDQKNPAVQQLASSHSSIRLIDICGPTLDVIQQVAACENVISSSLHGLILADSLDVPNQWIEFSDSVEMISGGGFKFRDYYSNFGLERMQPVIVSGPESPDSFLHPLKSYTRPGINDVKRELSASLEQLSSHFGGSFTDRLSLEKLRAQEHAKSAQHQNWNMEVSHLLTLLEKLIPPKERFILIDEEQIRTQVTHAPAIPLIQQNGEYWGAPLDDRHAISEVEQHRLSGIQRVAITNAGFWWLEEYPELQRWLNKNATLSYADNVLKVFHLH